MRLRAIGGGGGWRESPYKVLGVLPSAAPSEIKRAYRRLALQYHPDVNKEVNAQEKFLRIKHAYNTLMNSQSLSKYASSNPDSSWTSGSSKSADAEEQFYGQLVRKFVEFLENKLKIDDSSPEDDSGMIHTHNLGGRGKNAPGDNTRTNSSDDGMSDIEAILEQLKKELGLS